MTKQLWTRLLSALALVAIAARAMAADNNLPNCAPCEYWNGTACALKTITAYATQEVVFAEVQYRVVATTVPPGEAVSFSVVPPADGTAAGGSVGSGGVVSPDGSASVVTIRAAILAADGTVCCSADVAVPVEVCSACDTCLAGEDSASLEADKLQYTMKTGGADFEPAPALCVSMKTIGATAGQPTAENLGLLRQPGTEVIENPATRGVRQVLTAQALVDVVTTSGSTYEIRYYQSSQKGAKNGAGQYVPSGSPYLKHTVQYVAGASPILRITRTMGGVDRVVEFEQSGNTRKLRRGGQGSPVGWTAQTERASADSGGGFTNVVITMKDAAGVVTAKTVETNRVLAGGLVLLARVEDPDGSCPILTQYTYYTNIGQDNLPEYGYGQVKSRVRSDGPWVAHEYDWLGRETLRVEAWKDAAYDPQASLATLAAEARAIYSSYQPVDTADDGTRSPNRPRTVQVNVAGVPVSKTYYAWKVETTGRVEIEERCATPSASYGATGNLRTERWYDLQHPDRLIKVIQPGGVQQTLAYDQGTYSANGNQPGTFTVASGGAYLRRSLVQGTTSSPDGVANQTTKQVSIQNAAGAVLLSETHVKTDSAFERIAWQVHDLDTYGHELHRYTHNGEQADGTWSDCCGLESETDATGVQTAYPSYDGLKRPLTVVKVGVAASSPYPAQGDLTTTYEYNAAGQITRQTVSSGGLSLVTTNGFDPAGRPTTSRAPDGLATTHSYANGGRTVTVTRPGDATEITERYLDGRPKSLTGTGVIARHYDYGVNTDGTTWTTTYAGPDGLSSAQWEKVTADALGRTVSAEKPKFGGGTEVTAHEFDASGRLQRTTRTGLADTRYEYNALGALTRQGQDVDGNQNGLVLASKDRITDTDTSYVKDGNDWWRVTVQKVYATDNSATSTTVSTARQRLTGFATGVTQDRQSLDIHGNATTQTVAVDRAAKLVTQTTDTPDSTTDALTVSRNGLVQSTRGATGHTVTFTYDALGRQTGVTDPRTGTSETHYNSLGQVDWVQDAATNRTSFGYDNATGQRISVTNAANQVTYYAYTTRGEQRRVWGANTYPVEYAFDDFGRRHTLKTFRADAGVDWFAATWPASPGTPDTTTWNYDAATGLLLEKVYADSQPTTYTYEAQGRLATRTWARTVNSNPLVTTYSYDQHTGELLTVDYSDSTPDVTYTYNRLGQQAAVADVVGTRTFAYNSALQLATETVAGNLYNKVLTRQYQASGAGLLPGRPAGFLLGTTADPDADQTVTYGFDALGRLETVSDGARTFTYSRVADSDLLAGYGTTSFTVAYDYEAHRHVRTQVQTKYSATTLAQFDYATDAVGRRQTREQRGTVFGDPSFNDFDYNTRGEVTQSKRFAGTVANPGTENTAEDHDYAFDPIGNRQTSNVGNSATPRAYTANQLNQYTALTQPAQSPTHDADGNLTADATWTYTWDGENRLASMEKSKQRLEFKYDYQGRRVCKQVFTGSPGNWMQTLEYRFLYDGWNLIAILDGEAAIVQSFLWGLDLSESLQGAGGVGGLLALCEVSNGQVSATHAAAYDANGNVAALVNLASGTVTAHYEYGPFGEPLAAEGTLATANPFRFSTKFTDDETGMLYYGYRYYIPPWGRWASRDPIGEGGGLNLAVFLGNEPVEKWDFLGWESPARTKCNQMIENAEGENRDLKDLLARQGCPLPPIQCACCSDARKGGGYNAKYNKITICESSDPRFDQVMFNIVLKHEMIHAVQACYKEAEDNKCRTSVCKEIEAYYNSHCAVLATPEKRRDCVKRGVEYSSVPQCKKFLGTKEGTKKRIDEYFEDLYEKCKTRSR
jgi:RHS repeat-associated protein